jgi:UDP-3-O-[3-hydroxymyristoyl] N-acetylglucosamine deacetylase
MTTRLQPTLSGIGLITGLPVTVELSPSPAGTGIMFEIDGVFIPADPAYAVNTERGVTLGKEGKTLSIVEHFLSACAMTHHTDLLLRVKGAPELPLLDGSALEWVAFLSQAELPCFQSTMTLTQPVHYTDHEIQLSATPSDSLEITYAVDFDHPDLKQAQWTWQASEGELLSAICPARTFGFVSELPKLQASGLAKGVSLENTLGLYEDGQYTTPLRMPDEPIRHKILDFIGDMMLCGICIPNMQAKFEIRHGGHTSHLAFGQQLRASL